MLALTNKENIMYDIFSTYTHVLGSVSIHNLRNVAPRYGELLALLVYLTLRRSNGINQSRILRANEGQTHQEMLQVRHDLRRSLQPPALCPPPNR